MCFLPYSFLLAKLLINELWLIYQLYHKLPGTTRCVKNRHSADNDWETVLLHKFAFLCVIPVFRLDLIGFINAFILSRLTYFILFYVAFPEIFA